MDKSLRYTTLLVSAVLLIVGGKLLWTHAAQVTTMEALFALLILTMLVGMQVRTERLLRSPELPERCKCDLLQIVAGYQLMLGFGLWLATDLLRH